MQIETPSQRNELYKNALFMFESNGYIRGFCYLFKHFDISDLSKLPEIEKHKPELMDQFGGRVFRHWFCLDSAGRQKRIEILKQAIKETE